MIGSRSILALIPARGGSKGVKRKNVREVGGKPLIAWTIEAAKASRYIDRLILSSEDRAIIDVATAHGCEAPFVRPAELATDEADAMAVVRHALSALPERYDYLLLLQPTSPMRTANDIDGAIELCINARGAGLHQRLRAREESLLDARARRRPGDQAAVPRRPDRASPAGFAEGLCAQRRGLCRCRRAARRPGRPSWCPARSVTSCRRSAPSTSTASLTSRSSISCSGSIFRRKPAPT